MTCRCVATTSFGFADHQIARGKAILDKYYEGKVSCEATEWHHYIIDILKVLRTADKANWHHRMVSRVSRSG